MAVFVCGLLFYANAAAFKLISAPVFINDIIAYGALTVAVTLTIITLAIVVRDIRRSRHKLKFINSNKKLIVTSSTISSQVDSQENPDDVKSDSGIVKLVQQSKQETETSPFEVFSKENIDKDESDMLSIQTDEAPDTVSSSVIAQTTDEFEPNPAVVQTSNESDKASVTLQVKSSRKRILIVILIAISAGLLFYANVVAFNLIALPEYSVYVAMGGAVALTITTVATILIDKRRGALPKAPIVEAVGAVKESNVTLETSDTVYSPTIAQIRKEKVESDIVAIETAKVPDEAPAPIARPTKVFGKRNIFVIIVAFTVGLLFFANVVAFGLISLPAYVIYAAVVGAVVLASISVAVILGGKIEVLGTRIKRFISVESLRDIFDEEKETDQALDTAAEPVISQTTTKKVDSYEELFRQFGFQSARYKVEADKAEQEKLPKKPVILPTKVICPACRKEFNLPVYKKDLIVDFGSPKKSNLIEPCPYCGVLIPLKRKGDQEDIWKE